MPEGTHLRDQVVAQEMSGPEENLLHQAWEKVKLIAPKSAGAWRNRQ